MNRHERWDKWIRKRVLFHLHDKKNWHTLSLQFQFLATQRMCNSQKFTSIFTNTIFNYQSLSHFSNIELQFYNTFTILTFNAIWQMGLSHDMWICVFLSKSFVRIRPKNPTLQNIILFSPPLFKESWKRVFLRWIFSMVIKLSVEEIWTQFGRNKDRVFWYIGSQSSIIRKVRIGVLDVNQTYPC